MNIPPVIWILFVVVIVIVAVILLNSAPHLGVARRRVKQQEEDHLRQRIALMKDVTVNRQFHEPGDTDLDPNIEYINAIRGVTDSSFEMVLFSMNGISERKLNMSEDEVWKFAALGNWEHTADNYRTTAEGMRMIIQFERLRRRK
jgi:hypothetical protein